MFNKRMSRMKYSLLLIGITVIWFVSAVFLGGTFSQNVNGVDMLKVYFIPWYFATSILFLRRFSDVMGKEHKTLANISIALAVSLLGAFVHAFKPKYLLLPLILYMFLPTKKKLNSTEEGI